MSLGSRRRKPKQLGLINVLDLDLSDPGSKGRSSTTVVALEEQEAISLMELIEWHYSRYPVLRRLFFHYPSGGFRFRRTAETLKRMGVKPGVPDYQLAVSRGGFLSLWIELKRKRFGRLSDDQKAVIAELIAEGHCVEVCKGADVAWKVIEAYLRGEMVRDERNQPVGA